MIRVGLCKMEVLNLQCGITVSITKRWWISVVLSHQVCDKSHLSVYVRWFPSAAFFLLKVDFDQRFSVICPICLHVDLAWLEMASTPVSLSTSPPPADSDHSNLSECADFSVYCGEAGWGSRWRTGLGVRTPYSTAVKRTGSAVTLCGFRYWLHHSLLGVCGQLFNLSG